ncbi:hypothetical protein K8O68_09450 [Salipaludibacillus sp. CUR1]|uniref:hypothetical protein n=1 Tax=Salipaludibacillus sp. CUR1 TaxID=2820003 RepID=UPI001E4A77D9|nr:hypothetical protein [Salipaludibacillus sp. CUR1]MCE7792639.1 hypothetical protein [Salipaludibacillus sp. CUR1]
MSKWDGLRTEKQLRKRKKAKDGKDWANKLLERIKEKEEKKKMTDSGAAGNYGKES